MTSVTAESKSMGHKGRNTRVCHRTGHVSAATDRTLSYAFNLNHVFELCEDTFLSESM